MIKCAQCGCEYPESNSVCPKCGYGASSFAKETQKKENNDKVLKIVIIGVAVSVFLGAIFFMTFAKKLFGGIMNEANNQMNNMQENMNNMQENMNNMQNGTQNDMQNNMNNTMTLDECKNLCGSDGYMYVNGMCTCTSFNLE